MNWNNLRKGLVVCALAASFLVGCGQGDGGETAVSPDHTTNEAVPILRLPELQPADLAGGKLRVVATTSIIGDVVAQVGGTAIDLTTLMAAGQDPHSYEPGARELTAVADAQVIFINGWDLEESLIRNLENIGGAVPVVPVSANITPLTISEDEPEAEAEHDHSGIDPHVWLNVQNVEQWVKNIDQVFRQLDPDNAETYAANATAYLTQLAELEQDVIKRLNSIPAENRFLVTNHAAFNYFAQAYNFEVIGTVIPGLSTAAEPSASDLADLIAVMQAHQICSIFTETTVNDQLAQVVADELSFCDAVQILPLNTGTLGASGSGADNYLGWMRSNVDTIVSGLQ